MEGPKVVVVQLLALGRHGAEEGPPAEDQILPLPVEGLVHQEILLFRAHHGGNPVGRYPEETEDPQGLLAEDLHRPQEGCLLVQRLAAVGVEDRGNI